MMKLPFVSLYIHIPWCIHRCPYCDFNVHVAPKKIPEETYIDVLIADWKASLWQLQGRALHSIYIGGGTPSLFSASQLSRLLYHIKMTSIWKKNIEISLEINPLYTAFDQIKAWLSIGINRFSIGVQSFQSDNLYHLGRLHDLQSIHHTIDCMRQLHVRNFNLDVLYGLPHQSIENGLKDIHHLIALKPPHISWYQLTIEPHTPFYHAPPKTLSLQTIVSLEEEGIQLLEKHGYQHYAISAFSKPGFVSQHHYNYWLFGDYIGIGAGAHGKITRFHHVKRYVKYKHPKQYLEDVSMMTEKEVDTHDLIFEFMLNICRIHGMIIPESLFYNATGCYFKDIQTPLRQAERKELIYWNQFQKTIKIQEQGWRFYTDLVSYFI